MKFKVFNKEKKEFVDPEDYVIDSTGKLWDITRYGLDIINKTPIISTDQIDIDGNEIYEGDLMMLIESGYDHPDPYLVKWDKKHACFEAVTKDNFICPSIWDKMKKIGSIYTNPELLELKK